MSLHRARPGVLAAALPQPVAASVSGFEAVQGGGYLDINVLPQCTYAGTPSLRIVAQPASGRGSAAVIGTGSAAFLRYTPPASGYTGPFSFAYGLTATLNSGEATGTVAGTVAAPPPAPEAVNDPGILAVRGGPPVVIDVLANDAYGGGTAIPALDIDAQPPAGQGTVAVSGLGRASRVVFNPSAAFTGQTSFRYGLTSNLTTGRSIATVTVTVQAPASEQPGPAIGMRWSGTPDNAMHDDFLAKHGWLYDFYRTDGPRDSKTSLTNDNFVADRAQLFINRSSNTRGAVMYNWPTAVGTGDFYREPAIRTAALADAAAGGLEDAWRSHLRKLKQRGVDHCIFCQAIEGQGTWYPWGTGAHNNEAGYQQRNIDSGTAFRRFVRVALSVENEYPSRPRGWIFAFSPTLECWRNYPNDAPLKHYLENAYPGRGFCDASMPTFYDAPYLVSDRDLANATQAQRDAKWTSRWNSTAQIGWLTNFRNWCANQAGDIPTGFHELSLFSAVQNPQPDPNGDLSDSPPHRDQPIVYQDLHTEQGGNGDNWIFTRNMFDWVENPLNYCLFVGHFHELYKHDLSGFYHSGTSRPLSRRHPLAAEVFYERARQTGPFDVRASIAHCIARRPANFGV